MKINFYIADEIRNEQGGKPFLIGLYPDHVVVVNVGKDQPEIGSSGEKIGYLIERLAFLVCVSEAPGKHTVAVQYFDPSGNPLAPRTALPDFEIEKGLSASLVLESKPFPFPESGMYKLSFEIDGNMHELPFEMRVVREK